MSNMVSKEDVEKLYNELLPWDQQEFRDEIGGFFDDDYDPLDDITIGECLEHYGHQKVLEEFTPYELAEELCDYDNWDEVADYIEDSRDSKDRNRFAIYLLQHCPKIIDAIIDNADDGAKELLSDSERDWIYNKGYEIGYKEGKEDKKL